MRASLKLKLSGLFALLLLAAALQGGFAIHKMIALDRQLATLLDHAVLSMNEAQAIEALVIRTRLAQVRFVTAAAETERQLTVKEVDALTRERNAKVEAYRALIASPAEKALFDDLLAKLKIQHYDWERLRGFTLEQREPAMAYFRGSMNGHYVAAAGAAHALAEMNIKAGDEAGRNARRSQAEAVRSTVIMLGVTLLIALGATLYSFVGVSRPITIMTRRCVAWPTATRRRRSPTRPGGTRSAPCRPPSRCSGRTCCTPAPSRPRRPGPASRPRPSAGRRRTCWPTGSRPRSAASSARSRRRRPGCRPPLRG